MSTVIHRIDPPMLVEVVSGMTPKGRGLTHFLFDHGAEQNLVWQVVMDEPPHAGESWCVDNANLRFRRNLTYGRPRSIAAQEDGTP